MLLRVLCSGANQPRMDLQLVGKKALVTGSTAGIGLAIAQALAREGADVFVNGRTEARVNAAIAEVSKAAHGKVSGIAADLGTKEGCENVLAAAPELDILVNNVGIFAAIPFPEIPDDAWQEIFEVNVMSGVRLSRHHLPRMLKRNWGRILFISSESGFQIPSEMVHYGVTKTAQISLARGLAELTGGTNVTVNSVLPGPTKSEGVGGFVEGLAKQQNVPVAQVEQDFFKHARPSSLLQRFERPEEIGEFVAFLASPLSSGINGASLRVDGGVVRAI